MSPRTHQFLWLDLETTGLDPYQKRILEWAAVLAADDQAGDLSVVQSFTSVIGTNGDDLSKEMDDYVTRMHTTNGLLAECAASKVTLADSEAFFCGLAESLGAKPRSIVLAGGTVHFDLGFVRVHMPRFAGFLSHRVFDVSTLKAAERTWGGAFPDVKTDVHRALPDILASLEEARRIKAHRWASAADVARICAAPGAGR